MFNLITGKNTPKAEKLTEEEIMNSKDLFGVFKEYVKSLNNCAGLAANQTEINNEVLNKSFFCINYAKEPEIFINPEITVYNGDVRTNVEGCLSFPGKKIIAKRYPEITVRYMNEKGKLVKKDLKDMEAQVFQHEYDHIMGIEELFQYTKEPARNEPCPCGSGKKYKKCCF